MQQPVPGGLFLERHGLINTHVHWDGEQLKVQVYLSAAVSFVYGFCGQN